MTTVSIREFSHHMAKYMNMLKNGQGFILKYHNEPIGQVLPTNTSIAVTPGWKRSIKKIIIKGESLSETVVQMRKDEWR